VGCGRSVKYNPDKLEMLIEQLKQEYSDEEKKEYLETLKRIVNSRKKIEEKLILVFNCVYFGDAYIIQNEFSNAENNQLKSKPRQTPNQPTDLFLLLK